MKSITFNCEITTPMFIYGADNNGTPELRPPAIKSLMRFWWRVCSPKVKDLFQEEVKLFGGSGDDKAIKSPLRIRLLGKPSVIESYPIKPHRNENPIKALKVKQKFSLVLTSTEERLENYQTIFNLSTILGGFGRRARRGFGCISVIKEEISIESIKSLLEKISPETYFLENNEIKLNTSIKVKDYPFIKKIMLIDRNISDVNVALKLIGQASSDAKHNYYNSKALGEFKPRVSSPVYVSIIKNNTNFLFVVSILKSEFEEKIDLEKQNFFINFLKTGTLK